MFHKKQFVSLAFVAIALMYGRMSRANAEEDLVQEKKLSAAYLEKMAQETNAQTLDRGIVIRPIFIGDSTTHPVVTDTVSVTYHLVDREGKVVDESITADEVIVFPLAKLIQCWQIAVPHMTIGSFYKISCPSDTAYGDKGVEGVIKPGAALTFRLSLFAIQK